MSGVDFFYRLTSTVSPHLFYRLTSCVYPILSPLPSYRLLGRSAPEKTIEQLDDTIQIV